MNVRVQLSTVFHLDKCIGCHTCSVACKNIWTDREGADYMWWNNVETKPGTGYPTLWEDQEKYRGGWEVKNGGNPTLKATGKLRGFANIFFSPYMPTIDDYYEPWTYKYDELFNSPKSDDQPTAQPVSRISGKAIDIEAGPNWDDDLGGSSIYAANDPNMKKLTPEEKRDLFELERMVYFYLPRKCNHCLNPGCVAACPSGAAYKRGEDGIVLVSQDKCRGWRHCVSGCPYKKVYYNWSTGKSEKCILCYPRLESGQAPACYHTCPGRIRFLGVLLYDADRIREAVMVPDEELVESQRSLILDPNDDQVADAAAANGISADVMEAARKSPVYRFVKEWRLALPLHSEFRTLPNLFYVPPLLPTMASTANGTCKQEADSFFGSVEKARVPLGYMASLFSAGNQQIVRDVLKKLIAVRASRRLETVGDMDSGAVQKMLEDIDMTPAEAEQIASLSSLASVSQRFVIPPSHREMSIEAETGSTDGPQDHRGDCGFGSTKEAKRGL